MTCVLCVVFACRSTRTLNKALSSRGPLSRRTIDSQAATRTSLSMTDLFTERHSKPDSSPDRMCVDPVELNQMLSNVILPPGDTLLSMRPTSFVEITQCHYFLIQFGAP